MLDSVIPLMMAAGMFVLLAPPLLRNPTLSIIRPNRAFASKSTSKEVCPTAGGVEVIVLNFFVAPVGVRELRRIATYGNAETLPVIFNWLSDSEVVFDEASAST